MLAASRGTGGYGSQRGAAYLRLEGMLEAGRGTERIQQKPVHALFPMHIVPHLTEQFGVAGARTSEESLAFVRGAGQRPLDQTHYQVIVLRFVGHCRTPSARRATAGRRATFAPW